MSNNEGLTIDMVELIRGRARYIEQEIENLQEDLKGLQRTIAQFSTDGQMDLLLEGALMKMKGEKKFGPTEAVRKIIYSNPDKKWTPKEVILQFQAMNDYGSIEMTKDTKTPIATIVHGILGRLRKKDDVERKGSKGNHWYRKPILEENLQIS